MEVRSILFICATHGDEGFSVDVLDELSKTYNPKEYGYDWIIGNPLALKSGTRFIDKDLNRSAPGDPGSQYYDDRRAAEIIKLSRQYDAVIDIHGSVADCGVVTIVPYPTTENMALAESLPIERTVIWYSKKSTVSGPLAQYVMCPSVEIECGPKNDPVVQDNLKAIIGNIIVANLNDNDISLPDQELFSVYGKELGRSDKTVKDFQECVRSGEKFYPFLSANQYEGVVCYKLKRATCEDILL